LEERPDFVLFKTQVEKVTKVEVEVAETEVAGLQCVEFHECAFYGHRELYLALDAAEHLNELNLIFKFGAQLFGGLHDVVGKVHIGLRNLDFLTSLLALFSLIIFEEDLLVGIGSPKLANKFLLAHITLLLAVDPAGEHFQLLVGQV